MSRATKPRKKRQASHHSTIAQHQRNRKTLTPPLATLPSLKPSSWLDLRLPEMLWAALLISHIPRDRALDIFRKVADYNFRNKDNNPPITVTHTGIASLPSPSQRALLSIITADSDCIEVLRPLLFFRDLPAKDVWQDAIGEQPARNDWSLIMDAVAKTLDHQSQEATDCRWLRVICNITSGNITFAPAMAEILKGIAYYPNYGDLREIRPSIRAIEISFDTEKEMDVKWADSFWKQCLDDTLCIELPAPQLVLPNQPGLERIQQVYESLMNHWRTTLQTTSVDAKHDTVFGSGLYCLALLKELLIDNVSTSISARLILRSTVETYINLAYLAKKDDAELWKSHRVFGAGQAKLQYLKLEEIERPAFYVSSQDLEILANEDVWEEFLPIELGHWSHSDLRTLSEEAGAKGDYDTYYPWTSSFMHGHWGSIRDSTFSLCGNPLHRLHRIPRDNPRLLPSVIPDACLIVDKVLAIISGLYPDFPDRIA